MGLPLGATLNDFCYSLSLDKMEYRIRNRRPRGYLLLSGFVLKAFSSYYPEFNILETDRDKIPMFLGIEIKVNAQK